VSHKRAYAGSCHCGAVQFTAAVAPGAPLYRCNCSLCARKGALILEVAPADDLTVQQGWEAMSLYQWHTGVAKHYFCATCGIYTFHQRRIDPNSYGVNPGCLEDFQLAAHTIEDVDGANE
jgi:hypothetical protein